MVATMAEAREVAEKVVVAAGGDPQVLQEARMVVAETEVERAAGDMVEARAVARVEVAREEEREAVWVGVARAGAGEGEDTEVAAVPHWVGTEVAMGAEVMVEVGAVRSGEAVAPCRVHTDSEVVMAEVVMAGATVACQEAQAVTEVVVAQSRVAQGEAMGAVVMVAARVAREAWREAVLEPGRAETETGAAAGPMEAMAERKEAAVAQDWAEMEMDAAAATSATGVKVVAEREAASGRGPVETEEATAVVVMAGARVKK